MPTPGRNDPCPCRSGRKYKFCCGGSGAAVIEITSDDKMRAYDVLEHVTRLDRFAEPMDAATGLVSGDEDWTEVMEIGDIARTFVEWLSFDVPLDRRGQTAADYALSSHAADLTPGARRFIREMQQAPLRLVQVQTNYAFSALLCRDLVDPPAQYRVMDASEYQRHDVLAARIVERDRLLYFAVEPVQLFPDDRRKLVRIVQRMRRQAIAAGATPPLLRMIEAATLVRAVADSESLLESPLETAEGDPLQPTLVIFDVVDRQSLIDALAAADDFFVVPADDDTLAVTWVMRVPSVSRAFAGAQGHVLAASMEILTHSRPRAEAVRDRLLAIAGGSLVYRGLAAAPAELSAAGDEPSLQP
jgi:hypothetical protein